LVLPQPLRLGGRDDLRAGERRRRRCAIVLGAIFRGLRNPVLAADLDGCEDREQRYEAGEQAPRGHRAGASTAMGRSFSSSSGTPNPASSRLSPPWFAAISPLSCRFQFWSAARTPMAIRKLSCGPPVSLSRSVTRIGGLACFA